MRLIYCIEGHWEDAGNEPWHEPSVEPMLDMVRSAGRAGGWPYIRRNSATVGEMFYWLRNEWCHASFGSILYIASHGAPGEIWLSNSDESTAVETLPGLAEQMGGPEFADRCLIHFDGCRLLENVSDQDLDEFMERSGASAVSGYTTDAGWLTEHRVRHGVIPPAVALDAMFFSSIMERDIRLDLLQGDQAARVERRQDLRDLAEELQARFPTCGFRLRITGDRAPRS